MGGSTSRALYLFVFTVLKMDFCGGTRTDGTFCQVDEDYYVLYVPRPLTMVGSTLLAWDEFSRS